MKPLISATFNDLTRAPNPGALGSFAALVVDMQEFFCSPHRVPEKNAGNSRTDIAADQVCAFLPQLEMMGIPAIWIYTANKEGIANSPFGGFYKTVPSHGAQTVWKTDDDSFAGTDLESRLQKMNVRNLVIMGVNFGACVKATALTARARGYNVFIPMECTANNIMNTSGPISHSQQEPYAKKGVVLTDVLSLLRYLPTLKI